MLQQTGSKMCIFILAFVALAIAKPPPASPWPSFGKPAFLKSLGPPFASPGMSSISVPYMPKSSPFFPKFVDPKAFISKKTDMLSNLFGGLGPVDYTSGAAHDFTPYSTGFPQLAPILYTPNTDDDIQGIKEFTSDENVVGKDKMKRRAVGLGGEKFDGPKFSPLSPKVSPFASKFGPPGLPGFPFFGFPPKFGPGLVDSSRRRRSITETEDKDIKALKPLPEFPGLAPIAEEPKNFESKLLKLYDPASTPKEMVPGMFGPFAPLSPYAPITEIPIPKSTIVPGDFWLPSSIIPGPMEYTDKVATFLAKLFDSLALNKTAPVDDKTSKTVLARSLNDVPTQEKTFTSRSIEDIKSIAAAKDSIVDSILSELNELKSDMISTLNDFIVYQKTTAVVPGSKKPFKPISPFAAFFAPPTPDPALPFKQRMAILSQVFDMLTELQKNITLNVQDAINSSTDAPFLQNSKVTQMEAVPAKTSYFSAGNLNNLDYPATNSKTEAISSFNTTFFDAIKSRLAKLESDAVTSSSKPIITNDLQGNIIAQTLPKCPTSFLLTDRKADAAPAKRDVDGEDFEIPQYYENHRDQDRDQYKRAVQMQMHQGYQSMPPGTIESVQAGGGSVPGHQGGGIKLLDSQNDEEDWSKWSEWAKYFKNRNQGRKNYHNHH